MLKNFRTFLTVDWKTGKFKAYKKRPNKIKPSEIPIEFSLDVEVPETPEIKAHGKVTLTETKVSEMVVDAIDGEEDAK